MRTAFALITISAAALGVAGIATAMPQRVNSTLELAVHAGNRTPANMARDKYRHPAETLSFFRVKPTDTVVEIWPGGGWYTEILASYLRDRGTLYEAAPEGGLKSVKAMQERDPATYGKVRLASFPASTALPKVPDGSADVVLTFRNVHNWYMAGDATAQAAFDQMYRMLKPGGYLGVVDHRLPESMPAKLQKSSGYMKASTIIGYARKAGFQVDDMSDVNKNPKDTHNYGDGVWTLPPTYKLGKYHRARFTAIGESDRMTIRFRKPR